MVSWRNRVATLALALIAGLPMARTACALVCSGAAHSVSSHHTAGKDCEKPIDRSEVQVRGTEAHDCTSHDRAPQSVATAAARADVDLAVAPATAGSMLPKVKQIQTDGSLDAGTPSDSAPPGIAPLVLRV